jgi:hypothetical protein
MLIVPSRVSVVTVGDLTLISVLMVRQGVPDYVNRR